MSPASSRRIPPEIPATARSHRSTRYALTTPNHQWIGRRDVMANASKKKKALKTMPPQQQRRQPGREHEMTPRPEIVRPDYRGSGKLEGKAALITGGDSGIGRATAVAFAKEGADVAIIYYDEDRDARETADMVEAEGQRVILLRGDIAYHSFCRSAVERTATEFGRLDVLINNAAMQFPQQSIEDISDEQLDRTFRTNIF